MKIGTFQFYFNVIRTTIKMDFFLSIRELDQSLYTIDYCFNIRKDYRRYRLSPIKKEIKLKGFFSWPLSKESDFYHLVPMYQIRP